MMKNTLENVFALLEKRGERSTASAVSRIMGVQPSTVSRWRKGQRPNACQQANLAMLGRILRGAAADKPQAERIAVAILNPAGGGLLRLGIKGILIAAGLGWITED